MAMLLGIGICGTTSAYATSTGNIALDEFPAQETQLQSLFEEGSILGNLLKILGGLLIIALCMIPMGIGTVFMLPFLPIVLPIVIGLGSPIVLLAIPTVIFVWLIGGFS